MPRGIIVLELVEGFSAYSTSLSSSEHYPFTHGDLSAAIRENLDMVTSWMSVCAKKQVMR